MGKERELASLNQFGYQTAVHEREPYMLSSKPERVHEHESKVLPTGTGRGIGRRELHVLCVRIWLFR
jgi:hypothetical protein